LIDHVIGFLLAPLLLAAIGDCRWFSARN